MDAGGGAVTVTEDGDFVVLWFCDCVFLQLPC